jgi:RNA polymerase-associated protein LEO1
MPNFVKVDSKPFHPDTYVGPEHEEDFMGGNHERDMGIKLRVENTVRWRWTRDKDDQDVSPFVTLFPLVQGSKVTVVA